ncbi:MAG: amino acid permease [Deltaproteobacteria bacterium]|nr:amino acid permease [Deltaproteobacteria bacterium]
MERNSAGNGTGGFIKGIRLLDATMLVMGSMIGSGIFIVSADIARTVGSPAGLLGVWVLTGLMTVGAALCCGELAGMMPRAGGQYVYLREAWSPMVGFLYGWTLFLVIQTGTVAAVAVAFAKFLGVFWPAISAKNLVLDFGTARVFGRDFHPGVSTQQVAGILTLVLLTLVNLRGVRAGARVQNVFTFLKTGALATLVVAGMALGAGSGVFSGNLESFCSPGPFAVATFSAIGVAMVGSLFSADAWNNVGFSAEEVEDAGKNVAKAMALGATLVCVLYVITNLSYLAVLPLGGEESAADPLGRGIAHAAEDRVGTAVAEVLFGGAGKFLVAAAIMVSTFGCINGMLLTGARAYYAMARDGLFIAPIGTLSENTRVPAVSLVVQCVWACLLTLSGTYGQLLDYVIFAALLFYVVTIAGMMRMRRTKPDAPRPFRTPAYPVLPVFYIAAASAIMIVLLVHKPMYTWPGLIIVALGIPVYFAWKRAKGAGREA